ncbi:MAG: hypothetical protein J6V59_07155 [Alistipes sp.]|nr:hypothetical protein [Alistipes sp.]
MKKNYSILLLMVFPLIYSCEQEQSDVKNADSDSNIGLMNYKNMSTMQQIFLVVMAVAALLTSCENNREVNRDVTDKDDTSTTYPAELQSYTDKFNELIVSYGNFAQSDVVNTLLRTDWWGLETMACYNDELASEILYDFGGEAWADNFEPVLKFYADGELLYYTIDSSDFTCASDNGAWSYNRAMSTLTISMEGAEQNTMSGVNAKLLALGDGIMAIEWQTNEENVYRAVYRAFDRIAEDVSAGLIVDKMIAECKSFDAESVAQSIVGDWDCDLYVRYDADWSNVIGRWIVPGHLIVGGTSIRMTLNGDGTFAYCESPVDPKTEYIINGKWSYYASSCEVLFEWDNGKKARCMVVGFSSDRLIIDYTKEGEPSDWYLRYGYCR